VSVKQTKAPVFSFKRSLHTWLAEKKLEQSKSQKVGVPEIAVLENETVQSHE
jgi:hypothetical protein